MNTKGNRKIILIGLTAALILSLVANAVLAVMLAKEKQDPYRYLYDPEYAIGSDETIIDSHPDETDAPKTEIPTQYITLDFPEQLQDKIAINTTENEGSTKITFTGKGYEREVALFSVTITKEVPDGYLLGVLNDEAAGKLQVGIHVNEHKPEDWPEEIYKELCELQERVNDIIIQFHKAPRFTPNKPQIEIGS